MKSNNSKSVFIGVLCITTSMLLASCGDKDQSVQNSDKTTKKIDLETAMRDNSRPIDISKLSDENKSKYQCLQSTCGSEYPFRNEMDKYPERIGPAKEIVETKLKRPVELLMGQVIQDEMNLNLLVKQALTVNSERISFNEQQVGFLNIYQVLIKYNRLYAALDIQKDALGNSNYVFNPEKLKKLYPELSQAHIVAIMSMSKIYMNLVNMNDIDWLRAKLIIDQIRTKKDANNQILPEKLSEAEAFKLLVSQIDNMQSSVIKILNSALFINAKQVLKNKIARSELLTVKEKIDLINLFYKTYKIFMITISDDVLNQFAKIPFDKMNFLKTLKTIHQQASGQYFENKTKIKNILEKAQNVCMESLSKSYLDTPTLAENNLALQRLNLIQLEANEIVQKKMKQSLTDKLKIEFLLPKNQEESITEWNDSLILTRQSLKIQKSNLKNVDNIKDENLSSFLIGLSLRYQEPNADFLDSVVQICKKSEPAFLNDAANAADMSFQASWVTIKNLDYGIGIMAHEIGHLVSRKYKDLFKSEKDCLSGNYGSRQYEEEDFADLFASQVLNNLKAIGQVAKIKNLSCGFPDIKNPDLTAVNLENEYGAVDSHSSTFYRILSIAAGTEGLTLECSSYLKTFRSDKLKIFDNYCKIAQ